MSSVVQIVWQSGPASVDSKFMAVARSMCLNLQTILDKGDYIRQIYFLLVFYKFWDNELIALISQVQKLSIWYGANYDLAIIIKDMNLVWFNCIFNELCK